jgi:hypothetical protein
LSFFGPLAQKVQGVAAPHVEKATHKLAEVDEKQGLSLKANAGAYFQMFVTGRKKN